MSVLVGDQAPDFTLQNQDGVPVTLSSFKGHKAVVLVFYPMSFTGICTGELCELRDNLAIFQGDNYELLAISVDSKFVQKKFALDNNYEFDVLSDFWPHGAVAKQYGVFLEDLGFADRATFVINREGEVVAKFKTAPGQARDFEDYRRAIANI
ncbi:MAG: peroxiredoxin [Micrococcales bacterium]